jgi:protein-S-isoprenylcysteine O-methyltransferase Ste14
MGANMTQQQDSPNINKFVHPAILTLGFIILGILLGKFIPIFPALAATPLRLAGLPIVLVGLLIGFSGFFAILRANTTLNPHGTVTTVVTSGAYRFTRNPMYLGFLLMVIGFPLSYGSLWGLILVPFFIVTMNRLVIEKEEAYLEKKFGEPYTSFKRRVRRWL